MSGRISSSVQVHQGGSSRSSSASGTRPSPSPTIYREYVPGTLVASTSARYSVLTQPAANHTSQVIRSGSTTVVQHNKRHYDINSPSPSYRN
ncbi:hypothetical protein ACQKWADRAFT_98518 [Trichoderma austrokoningii]